MCVFLNRESAWYAFFYADSCLKEQHTGFLGVDLEMIAGRPVSCRIVTPNLNQVVGVGLHTLQPCVVLPPGYHHPLGAPFTVFMIPPVLHLGHIGTEVRSKTGLG